MLRPCLGEGEPRYDRGEGEPHHGLEEEGQPHGWEGVVLLKVRLALPPDLVRVGALLRLMVGRRRHHHR